MPITLVRESGADRLDGGEGDDARLGRGARDLLRGGAGKDAFVHLDDLLDSIDVFEKGRQVVRHEDVVEAFDPALDTFTFDLESLSVHALDFAHVDANAPGGVSHHPTAVICIAPFTERPNVHVGACPKQVPTYMTRAIGPEPARSGWVSSYRPARSGPLEYFLNKRIREGRCSEP